MDSTLNYRQSLEYLFARTTGGVKFGLDRTIALLDAIGNPQHRFPSLHIAGTNGKGSSVAIAEALLSARGLRVARYTSPHLIDFRERIVVAGEAMPADAITTWIEEHTPLVERLGATFFEATTAMAFDYFASIGVDVAVVEVGLGGRLDSTNVVNPVVAGVTNVAFDHMEYLGDSLEQIAVEKAGIYKPGRPAVVGGTDARIAALLANIARARDAPSVRVVHREVQVGDIDVSENGTTFSIQALGQSRRLRTPLPGHHQAWNVAFTLVLLDAGGHPFATTLDEAEQHLHRVRLLGRFQHVEQYIFDVAHNADGIDVLARTLAQVHPPPRRPLVVLMSVLRDKNWQRMLTTLAPLADQIVLTVAPSSPRDRMWSLTDAATFAREHEIDVVTLEDFDDALRRASDLGATVLVTGSFHTVGDAMDRLQLSPVFR